MGLVSLSIHLMGFASLPDDFMSKIISPSLSVSLTHTHTLAHPCIFYLCKDLNRHNSLSLTPDPDP